MLELRILTSSDVGLNVSKASFDTIAEFLEFVKICDESVNFFVDVARFVNLLVDGAIGIYDGNGR